MVETNLDKVRVDLRGLLDEVGMDVAVGLRAVIAAGRIDGDTYGLAPAQEKCVLGTAAYLLDGSVGFSIGGHCSRWSADYYLLENFEYSIRSGDIPDLREGAVGGPRRAAMLVSWIDEWVAEASDVRG